jgi:hypothetical protein
MTDSVAGGPDPRGETPSPVRRRRGRPARQMYQTYRVSAVRRPSTSASAGDEPPPAAVPVTDEELVDALVTGRTAFLARLRELADKQATPGDVIAVELVDVRPASSVLLELLYRLKVDGNAGEVVSGFTAAVIVAVRERLQSALRAPVAVAAAPTVSPAPAAAAAAAAGPSSTWDKVAPVLAAIGTGIGVLGFVIFVGGVIVWARLNGAGFPAAPALSVYPKQDLLVIGAQTLVPQVLVALLAVAVLSAVYAFARRQNRVGEMEATLLAGRATWFGAAGMFCFVLLMLVGILLWYHGSLDAGRTLVGLLLALGGGALAALVGSVTRRYVYLAVTSFVIVGVFMTFVAYWRARDDNKVRGAALIRDHKRVVAGIFLTEGAGRVYLARVSLGRDGHVVDKKSRIVGIDKSEVTDLGIAGAKVVGEALADARGLARELCALQPKVPPKEQQEDCATGRRRPAPQPSPARPKITPYTGVPIPAPLDRDGAVLLVLPPISEDVMGVVSFVTRDRVWTTAANGDRQRVQVALSTKPFRAQEGHPIRLRLHLSPRARRAIDEAGGALPARLRVVAVGSKGLAGRDDHGCVVLRTRGTESTAHC